jgi:hypothetical protein
MSSVTVWRLESGKLAAVDTPANLKIQHGQKTIVIQLLEKNGDIRDMSLPMDDVSSGQQITDAIGSGRLLTIHSQEATLADVFIKLTGRSLK